MSRRRDKVRDLFRSSSPRLDNPQTTSRSTSPLPNSPSPNLLSPSFSRTTSQSGPAQSSSISLTASNPTPPTTSIKSNNILQNAWQGLPHHQRRILEPYFPANADDGAAAKAMEQSFAAAKQRQQQCDEKRLKFTFAGRTVVLKEAADTVVNFLNRLKYIGGLVANADPAHVGIPWAVISFVLNVAVSETEQMAALLVGCETALYIMNRLKVYMEFLAHVPPSQSRTNFETSLTELYALVLSFLAQAIETYQRSTAHRALNLLWKGSDVQDFEQNCNKVGNRVEIEAQNCDRTLSGEDREMLQQLQDTLEKLRQDRQLHMMLERLEIKIDISNIKFVKEAAFDAYGQVHQECHSDTRVDVLRDIQDWARDANSPNLFWLQGMAGTGKSTVSYTIAKWLSKQGMSDQVELGASFYFKRGVGDRGSAVFLFPTIAYQLVRKVPGLGALIAEAASKNPEICSKALSEQFETLIHQPLKILALNPSNKVYVVIIDALDECKRDDIDIVLQLWFRDQPKHLKLFLTSRPDLPIQLRFNKLSKDAYRELVLHDVPQIQVQHDILTFLKDEFATFRQHYNEHSFEGEGLDDDWPGEKVLLELTDMAVPLFIVAATIHRFVNDDLQDPQERLELILQSHRKVGELSQMAVTYLPILQQLHSSTRSRQDEEELYARFRAIIGSVVTLVEPLSQVALANILNISPRILSASLRPFSSVLQMGSSDSDSPVRPLHNSFGEFLTSDGIEGRPFRIDVPATHDMLTSKCLRLLSQTNSVGLSENMFDLRNPGQLRKTVDSDEIQERFPAAVQYACKYWTYHAQNSRKQITDDGTVHRFLQRHFLHWLEALSFLDCVTDAITYIETLRSLLSQQDSINVTAFLNDARRFILSSRYIINLAPLQLYSSVIIFAPQDSVVRNECGQIPDWITPTETSPRVWGPELQQLEGHKDYINSVVFSADSSQLASASCDKSIRLWDIKTGQEVQKLVGHNNCVRLIAFSIDSNQLASVSTDCTIRLWNIKTGQEVQRLECTDIVTFLKFSDDGGQLISASADMTVQWWNLTTGHELHRLEMDNSVDYEEESNQQKDSVNDKDGHSGENTVVFSVASNLIALMPGNKTIRIWDVKTKREQILRGHTGKVSAAVFSSDGHQLASASRDRTVRLWDTSTGRQIRKFDGHTSWVKSVTISADGSKLASVSEDQTVQLWSTSTGQRIQKLEGHTGYTLSVSFSPDGSQLASASEDETVRLWDAKMKPEAQRLRGHTDRIHSILFLSDGSQLITASEDNTIRMWDTLTRQEIQKLEGHNKFVLHVALSPDERWLASASDDRTIRLWDVKSGQQIQKFEGHTLRVFFVAFSPDGSQIASASMDRTVRIWDLKSAQEVVKLEGHTDWVNFVQFSPDGSQLVSASDDRTVRIWDVTERREVCKLEGHTGSVFYAAFSADGGRLASVSHDEILRLWDLRTGQQIRAWHDYETVQSVSFSENGEILVTNRGDMAINTLSPKFRDERSQADKRITIKRNWVEREGQRLLWLPPSYRTDVTAVYENLLVLGGLTGNIIFLQFGHL